VLLSILRCLNKSIEKNITNLSLFGISFSTISIIFFIWAQFILVESFAKFNIIMAVVWIILGVLIVREHKKLSREKSQSQLSEQG